MCLCAASFSFPFFLFLFLLFFFLFALFSHSFQPLCFVVASFTHSRPFLVTPLYSTPLDTPLSFHPFIHPSTIEPRQTLVRIYYYRNTSSFPLTLFKGIAHRDSSPTSHSSYPTIDTTQAPCSLLAHISIHPSPRWPYIRVDVVIFLLPLDSPDLFSEQIEAHPRFIVVVDVFHGHHHFVVAENRLV